MKDGQKIVFHGEGDQEPGLEPGDIIIVLEQKTHPVFTRYTHGGYAVRIGKQRAFIFFFLKLIITEISFYFSTQTDNGSDHDHGPSARRVAVWLPETRPNAGQQDSTHHLTPRLVFLYTGVSTHHLTPKQLF